MFTQSNSEVYIPDGSDPTKALGRTTHLCIAAHQDDIEIMAIDGILRAYERSDAHFTGCVVTDGHGSPRAGKFADVSDDEMARIRVEEQKEAARIGKYSAQVFLGYPSVEVKKVENRGLKEDLKNLVRQTRPQVLFTHNLADKHNTHVGVLLRVLEALRELEPEELPEKLIGCEVWRNLDWLPDEQKVVMDVSTHRDLQAELVDVFVSQVQGGKNYTDAVLGRRAANATFFASHATDQATALTFGMDMTPLMLDKKLEPFEFVKTFIGEFQADVAGMIERLK
ncbi:MAG: PIG-L family deacetylase [Anaerolineaceae bacterium]|nr:PIG-L family deacetylase [Anaerolineaceae bacterium]MDD4042483.1 PIG-L family deacetylase [Anaerolineaceae bacterium]